MNILSEEEKTLLKKTASLMEELIETVEVAEDEELQQDLREALEEAERGEVKPLKQLLRELKVDLRTSLVGLQILTPGKGFEPLRPSEQDFMAEI